MTWTVRRSQHPRFQGENFTHNRTLAAHVEALAAAKGCTAAQVTLAWLLAQGDDVVAIPGTRYQGAAGRECRGAGGRAQRG